MFTRDDIKDMYRESKIQSDFETLIDADDELSWTCPRCLYRNQEDACDGLWPDDWTREGHLIVYCADCDHEQKFLFEWEPSFRPVVKGSDES